MIVKNYLTSTITQETLPSSSILSIENDTGKNEIMMMWFRILEKKSSRSRVLIYNWLLTVKTLLIDFVAIDHTTTLYEILNGLTLY